jgi:hypothetical protein
MTRFIFTLSLLGLCMAIMAVGLLVGKRLKGSCGGILSGKDCFCDRNGLPRKCDKKDQ